MPNYWNIPGVPHRGWSLENVEDIRADGQSEWDTDYETCMMCGHEKIRFVHIVSHTEYNGDMRVGCNCAEKMTNDYAYPKLREQALRNRASRRLNWHNKIWQFSKRGNYFLKLDGKIIIIHPIPLTRKYTVSVNGIFGKKRFDTLSAAKIAAFNGVEYFKEHGKW
jgi:hypothetical protein